MARLDVASTLTHTSAQSHAAKVRALSVPCANPSLRGTLVELQQTNKNAYKTNENRANAFRAAEPRMRGGSKSAYKTNAF